VGIAVSAHALRPRSRRRRKSLLIIGGAGGVGSIAIQLARARVSS
jgi:NADPH:quinone reductase-like Zn-dependent oxidoreductase